MFDTKGAAFDPANVAVLLNAMALAARALSHGGEELSQDTMRKLGKVVTNITKHRMLSGGNLQAEGIGTEASEFLAQLRALSLLS